MDEHSASSTPSHGPSLFLSHMTSGVDESHRLCFLLAASAAELSGRQTLLRRCCCADELNLPLGKNTALGSSARFFEINVECSVFRCSAAEALAMIERRGLLHYNTVTALQGLADTELGSHVTPNDSSESLENFLCMFGTEGDRSYSKKRRAASEECPEASQPVVSFPTFKGSSTPFNEDP